MVVKYVLVIFLSFIAAGEVEAELAKPMISMPMYAALSDGEQRRNADMNTVKEQLKHLNCIFRPCLYGGLCQLLDIDGKFVEDEFGVELGVFEDELSKETFAKEATTTNFAKQQVAILRSLEDYFYRLETSSNKAEFIKNHAENSIQCICRPGSHPKGQCKGCGYVELIEEDFRAE